jgi:hypothetical protein
MQHVGTEIFRNRIDSKFWINAMETALKNSPGLVVIDDVRFQDEANLIKKLGGRVVFVDRPGHANKDLHSSEQAGLILTDTSLDNSKDLTQLRVNVTKEFKEYFV